MPNVTGRDGIQIYYEVAGDGDPILLVHGFAMGSARWSAAGYVSRLAEEFRVIVPDLRGHGKSDRPHGAQHYKSDLVLSDLIAILDSESAKQAHYWGYSLGAIFGRGLLSVAPERLGKVILGGSGPLRPPLEDPPEIHLLREQGIGAYVAAVGPNLTPEARASFLQNDAEALVSVRDARLQWSEPEGLPNHRILVYAGEEDGEFQSARAYAETLPNGTFVGVPGANHGMTFARSGLILDTAIGFLQET